MPESIASINVEGLDENFRFIAIEVGNQINATYEFLQNPTPTLYDKIISRDDYIDNLKNVIENKCFSRIHFSRHSSQEEINVIRAAQIMCVNLERIADFCVNIARQMGYLRDHRFLNEFDYGHMFEEIQDATERILPGFHRRDLSDALAICRSEYVLDKMYKDSFDQIMTRLCTGRNVPDLITVLFIFRYLERVGDSLLNIGEALIFATIGEKIKIEQFQALQQTLSKTGYTGDMADIDFQSIWGTRSGCRIGRVEQGKSGADYSSGSIFKEGNIKKIRREKENIERWNELYPGLGPRVFSYHEESEKASLLVEFLPGCTLDEIVFSADAELLRNSMFVLEQTVSEIWRSSMKPDSFETDYVRQIESRLEGILNVHPDFKRPAKNLGALDISSTEELLEMCAEVEKEVPAPFSVLIHGDFNINNIVYSHDEERVHYIDLYRSRDMDYVQDVSVFLLSNFRIPFFESNLRRNLNWVIKRFYGFAERFAKEHDDETFQARMAFGLARSFFTSTRFELNFEFAREMFLRGHFLMEKILRHRGRPWNEFELPMNVLIY
jgi:phosphate uptake regulator